MGSDWSSYQLCGGLCLAASFNSLAFDMRRVDGFAPLRRFGVAFIVDGMYLIIDHAKLEVK